MNAPALLRMPLYSARSASDWKSPNGEPVNQIEQVWFYPYNILNAKMLFNSVGVLSSSIRIKVRRPRRTEGCISLMPHSLPLQEEWRADTIDHRRRTTQHTHEKKKKKTASLLLTRTKANHPQSNCNKMTMCPFVGIKKIISINTNFLVSYFIFFPFGLMWCAMFLLLLVVVVVSFHLPSYGFVCGDCALSSF